MGDNGVELDDATGKRCVFLGGMGVEGAVISSKTRVI